jgi:hypothetical protein
MPLYLLAVDLPTIEHVLYIPGILVIGIILGWVLRSNARPTKSEYDD